jgi:hypothetical protein
VRLGFNIELVNGSSAGRLKNRAGRLLAGRQSFASKQAWSSSCRQCQGVCKHSGSWTPPACEQYVAGEAGSLWSRVCRIHGHRRRRPGTGRTTMSSSFSKRRLRPHPLASASKRCIRLLLFHLTKVWQEHTSNNPKPSYHTYKPANGGRPGWPGR